MSSNSLRVARLRKEHEKLKELSARSPFIKIQSTQGNPPEKYNLHLTCKGIIRVDNDRPVIRESHNLEILLPDGYPRERPQFTIRSEMFNPNVWGNGTVCIGDEGDHGYAPAMGLDDLVIRIVQIIRFENIDTGHAANYNAATWAASHMNLFPLDRRQIVGEMLIDLKIDEGELDINILDKGDELGIVIS